MELPNGKFSAELINKEFFPGYLDNLKLINLGRCYDWAYYAWCMFPNVSIWMIDQHAWIRSDNKHYDCEAVKGVTNYRSLPLFDRYPELSQRGHEVKSIFLFKNFWNQYGGGYRNHWHTLIERIQRYGFTVVRE